MSNYSLERLEVQGLPATLTAGNRAKVSQTAAGKEVTQELKVTVSVDRLTICGQKAKNLDTSIKDQYEIFGWPMFAHYPYRYAFKMIDGSYLSLTGPDAPENVSPVRLDFNPSKCNEELVCMVLEKIVDGHLTRVDIAIDYFGQDFGYAVIRDRLSRQRRIYFGRRGERQTEYIGAAQSDNQIRVYNKALEQGLQDEYYTGWWRVEAQCRVSGGEMDDKNPFKDIRILLPYDRGRMLKVTERAMLEYLRNHPEAWQQMSPQTRKKYEDMEEFIEPLYGQPSEIYERTSQKIAEVVGSWVRIAQRQQVLLRPKGNFGDHNLRAMERAEKRWEERFKLSNIDDYYGVAYNRK